MALLSARNGGPRWSLAGPYLAVAAVLVAVASLVGGFAWVLLWPAASLVLVSSGYLGLGPRVFGKRADGSRSWPLGLLALPYRVVAHLRWRLRRSDVEPAYDRVTSTLYLGRRPRQQELPTDVDLVLDLTAELDPLVGSDVAYVCAPSLDFDVPDEAALRAAVDVAADAGTVYVHCAAGRGRSAMAAAAILVRRGEARDVHEAYDQLKAARPAVRKNRWQARLAERVAARVPIDPR